MDRPARRARPPSHDPYAARRATRRSARPRATGRPSCASSASAAPASTRSTAWSRPRSRASSSSPSTPTCSRCSSRPPTSRCTSARSITRGLGSGSNPDLGRAAAMEEYDKIKALLKGSDMVFIAAGAGGGTGTGAAPDRGAHRPRARRADRRHRHEAVRLRGLAPARRRPSAASRRSRDEVDTLIVVPNNRLLSVLDKHTSMVEAFRVADDVLRQGVQGISDLVTLPGLINLDFADVRTIMSEAGQRPAGHRHGHGRAPRDRGRRAGRRPRRCWRRAWRARARSCSRSPAGSDLSLWEVNEAAKAVVGGRAPRREHHLRRDGRREARGPGVGDGRGHRLRRAGAAAAPARAALEEPAGEPRVAAPRAGASPRGRGTPRRRSTSRSSCRGAEPSSRVGAPGSAHDAGGIVAAGHPLTAEAGARVLRDGGNAVDAAVAAMLASWVAEPLLTGPGAGGYMLVAGAGEEPTLLDFFVAAPGAGSTGDARAARCRVEVVLRRRDPGLPRRRRRRAARTATRPASRRRARALGHRAARRPRRARRGAGPRRRRVNAAAGLPLRDPRGDPRHDAGGARRCSRPAAARCAPATRFALPRAGRRDRAPRRARARRRSTPATSRRPCVDWVGERGGRAHRRGPRAPTRRSRASRCARPTAGARSSRTRRRRPAARCSRSRWRCSTATPGPPSLADDRRRDGGRAGRAHRRVRRGPRASPASLDAFLASRLGSTTHISVLDGDGRACVGDLHERRGLRRRRPGHGIHVNNIMGEEDLSPLGFHRAAPGRRMPSMMAPTVGARATARSSSCSAAPGPTGSARAILQTIVGRRRPRAATPGAAVEAPRVHFEDGVVYAEPGVPVERARRPRRIVAFREPQPVLRRRAGGRARPGDRRAHRGGGPAPRRRRGRRVRAAAASPSLAALRVAGCGSRRADLFVVERSGSIPGAEAAARRQRRRARALQRRRRTATSPATSCSTPARRCATCRARTRRSGPPTAA